MSDLPSWCRVGAKVVCVPTLGLGANGIPRNASANYPEQDGVYTIRKIVFDSRDDHPLLLLVEVRNGHLGYFYEPGFGVEHFRPVAPKTLEDDIATHFEQYLKTDHRATRRVGEDA